MVLNQIGIKDDEFYKAVQSFKGAARRLEQIAVSESAVAFKDFAHSPSKLKATVSAVKQQYPKRKLVACMELHTFSSLKKDFLPEYKNAMAEADEAFVYFNPHVVEHKRLEAITADEVQKSFGTKNVKVFTDSVSLQEALKAMSWKNSNLLLMSSGNFDGVNLDEFARGLIE